MTAPARFVGSFYAKDLEVCPDSVVELRPFFTYTATGAWGDGKQGDPDHGSLSLDDNPLEDLTPLGALTKLSGLSVTQTQVKSLEALSRLRLQELNISGSAVISLAGVGAPLAPGECAHLLAEEVPFSDDVWATEREQLCGLGRAVRASRPGDADSVTCGKWCETH